MGNGIGNSGSHFIIFFYLFIFSFFFFHGLDARWRRGPAFRFSLRSASLVRGLLSFTSTFVSGGHSWRLPHWPFRNDDTIGTFSLPFFDERKKTTPKTKYLPDVANLRFGRTHHHHPGAFSHAADLRLALTGPPFIPSSPSYTTTPIVDTNRGHPKELQNPYSVISQDMRSESLLGTYVPNIRAPRSRTCKNGVV